MRNGLHNPLTWVRLIATNFRRLAILIGGFTIVGAGFALLVLPGPGILVIVVGLAVLAQEFAWAERTLDRTKSRASEATLKLTSHAFSRMVFAMSGAALIVGGGIAAVIAESRYLVPGISAMFAGGCGLAILVPRVRAWIEASGVPRNGSGGTSRD